MAEDAATPQERETVSRNNRGSWRKLRVINEFLESLAKLGLVAAAVVAGAQYFSEVENCKVERVLDYSTDWDSGALLDAQRRLYEFKATMNGRIGAAEDHNTAVLLEEQKLVKALQEQTGPDGIGNDFALIIDFMEKVATCKRRGICDDGAVQDFFKAHAVAYASGFQCYLLVERAVRGGDAIRDEPETSQREYGDGMLEIAGIATLAGATADRCAGGTDRAVGGKRPGAVGS